MRLTRVDLPTFGRPTTASTGAAVGGSPADPSWPSWPGGVSSATGHRRPAPGHAGQSPPTTSSRPSLVVSISTASAAIDHLAGVLAGRGGPAHAGWSRPWPPGRRPDRRCGARRAPSRMRSGTPSPARVGRHHRTDIPALGHDARARRYRLGDDLLLHADQQVAYLRDGRDGADRVGDLAGADLAGRRRCRSTMIRGAAGSVPTVMTGSSSRPSTAAVSATSTSWLSSHQVRARYIAPVSR